MLTDMDKILISGENEFLGLRLAERSIKEGFEVTVVNYFSTSNRVNIPDEATIIRGRVEDISLQNNFEHIVNLAVTVSVDKIFWQSTKYFSASTNSTSNPYDILIHEKVSLFKIKKMSWPPGKAFTVKALTHATLISVTIISKNLARVFKTLLNGVPV